MQTTLPNGRILASSLKQVTKVKRVTHAQETYTRNLYKKFALAPMHVTKMGQFNWSTQFENFWY